MCWKTISLKWYKSKIFPQLFICLLKIVYEFFFWCAKFKNFLCVITFVSLFCYFSWIFTYMYKGFYSLWSYEGIHPCFVLLFYALIFFNIYISDPLAIYLGTWSDICIQFYISPNCYLVVATLFIKTSTFSLIWGDSFVLHKMTTCIFRV